MIGTLTANLLREQPELRRDPRELQELEEKNKYLGGDIYGINGMKTRRKNIIAPAPPPPMLPAAEDLPSQISTPSGRGRSRRRVAPEDEHTTEMEEEKSSPGSVRGRGRGRPRGSGRGGSARQAESTGRSGRCTTITRAGAENAVQSAEQCLNCRIRHRDGFMCGRNTPHVTCSGCGNLFPQRQDTSVQCELCDKYYCNLYWTCSHTGLNKVGATFPD